MNGKSFTMRALIGLLAVLLAAPPGVFAQDSSTARAYSQEELAQMLAPIALYPDSLLAQVLVAATYPDQIREADLWVKQNSNLKGNALNDALDRMNWDLSVKALVPFPKVPAMMDEKSDWTQKLGDAFMAQQAAVMDTIQTLRARAKAEGNLESNSQQKVAVKGESIEIEPANPELVYVPYYDPLVVFGPWWYPAYPPYAYFPYHPGPDFVAFGLFGFAAGIAVGSAWNWGWGSWNWGRGDVFINVNRTVNINTANIGTVNTTSFNQVAGQRRLGATGTTGVSGANRLGTGAAGGTTGISGANRPSNANRPSAASVQNQLRQGSLTAQHNQAGTRSGGSQLSRGTNSANAGGTRHGGTNLDRSSTQGGTNVSRGNTRATGPAPGSLSRGGGGGMPHGGGGGGQVAHGGGARCQGKHC